MNPATRPVVTGTETYTREAPRRLPAAAPEAARCKLLIAVSETTRDDLVERYGVAPERVRVVPLGISPPSVQPAPAARLAELGLDGDFVLQVGRVETRKNQVAALAAVERLDG